MKRIFMLLLIFVFLLTGCKKSLLEDSLKDPPGTIYPNITSEQKMIPTELLKQGKTSLEDLIIFSTDYKYSISIEDSLKIVERIDEGNTTFVTYTFEHGSKPYFGGYFAWHENGKWYLLKSYEDFRNLEVPGETAFMTGTVSVPIHPKQKIPYYIRFGYVNNKDITRVTLQYTDHTLSNIQLGHQQDLYMDPYLNDKQTLSKITMVNDSGKVIWEREWN